MWHKPCRTFHPWCPCIKTRCLLNFFGQPGSVSKFPPFLWVKLWVGWVGRGYTEISRYFPASWINWVTLVTKKKLVFIEILDHLWITKKCLYGMLFLRLKAWFYVQYTIPPPAAMLGLLSLADKQRFLTPGHQGWNDLHSLCRIGMEYY